MNLVSEELRQRLASERRRWLVTGAAGFIGSNLVEALLDNDQEVVGLDNLSTGFPANLFEAQTGRVNPSFRFVEGDIRDAATCAAACESVDIVLHQAALGSVPLSIEDPATCHAVNLTGFINMLDAARIAGASRFVYASSSAIYGDSPALPSREEQAPAPLSPYAATKLANEIYAAVYARSYDFHATGLRYFNVFGPRQDPNGAYSAVIPTWAAAMAAGRPIVINGDGSTTRDFCFIADVVEANLRVALGGDEVQGEVFNIARGGTTSLLDLFEALTAALAAHGVDYPHQPTFNDFRHGDILHSRADVGKAASLLGFTARHSVADGIAAALPWYLDRRQASDLAK